MDYIVSAKTGEAIQQAIEKAAAAGGGRVVLEPGIYPSGTLYLRDNINLHLEAGAVIFGREGSDSYDDFNPETLHGVAPEKSQKCLIAADSVKNIAITGDGEINGNGLSFYDTNVPEGECFSKPPHPRPRMIQFVNCTNIKLEGISVLESPNWNIYLAKCRDIKIHNIRVMGDHRFNNGDGIDFDSCSNAVVSDSIFNTSDDCLILRAIRHDLNVPSICEQITVTNCILNSRCNGIRLGCPSDDTIRNCSFNNIIFKGTGAGIHCEVPFRYLRKNCTGYLNIYNISFNNFNIDCGRYPVRIGIEDGLKVRGIDNMHFNNFIIKSNMPIFFKGSAKSPLTNISLNNISGVINSDNPLHTQFVRNLKLEKIDFTADVGEEVPFKRIEWESWETKF